MANQTPREIIIALAAHVRSAVLPHLGTWRARKVTGIASSGDATFDIDDIAEGAVEQFLRDNKVPVAYYSEDRGLIPPPTGGDPEGVLIIDPIDGTRGAIAGFEACVVSVAWADAVLEPKMKDVRYGAIAEIKGSSVFFAGRGEGAGIVDGAGGIIPITLSPNTEIATMAWAAEVVGAPMDLLFSALADFANPTTVTGGFFILNSSAFELTRLLTGQLSAVVDVRNRVLREVPSSRDKFTQYGGGRLLSLYAYDIAAAALMVTEAGGVITDAWGNDLAEWKLLDTTEANFGSMLAASNPILHAKLVEEVNKGITRVKG